MKPTEFMLVIIILAFTSVYGNQKQFVKHPPKVVHHPVAVKYLPHPPMVQHPSPKIVHHPAPAPPLVQHHPVGQVQHPLGQKIQHPVGQGQTQHHPEQQGQNQQPEQSQQGQQHQFENQMPEGRSQNQFEQSKQQSNFEQPNSKPQQSYGYEQSAYIDDLQGIQDNQIDSASYSDMQMGQQNAVDGMDSLAAEIVEAVVERLEEDEALAIEMERHGIDQDAVDSSINLKTISFIHLLIFHTILYFLYT